MLSREKNKFMVQLEKMVFNLDRAAIELDKMDLSAHSDSEAYSDNIKTHESCSDGLVHQVITDLNQTFITPIEHGDILPLCDTIDDVLDVVEGTAAMSEVYSVEYTDEYMAELVDNIQKAVAEMKLAVGLLVDKKLSHMRIHSVNIRELETNCDGILRQLIRHIFNSETDPTTLAKIKDICKSMEEIADKCQIVINSFETVITRNS